MDYKKYSLENLENWLNDCLSSGEETSKEIYDVIVKVVRENYYHHKHHASQAYDLMCKLNGEGKGNSKEFDDCVDKILSCDRDDPSSECKGSWNDFWQKADVDSPPVYVSEDGDVFVKEYPTKKEDKVVKWILPVELDGLTGECYILLPDDLLERAGLKEGDTVEWINLDNGSFEMRKVNGIE